MSGFLETWAEAALTTLGLFWMALWAFALGYIISSCIQVFVTRERMKRAMGEAGPKSVALGTGFGFISSSCSFAALSSTRALFQKGAGLVPSLAFLLASTNLVVELGILIFIFLAWQFVVGEYLGGILLILIMWLVVKLTLPKKLVEQARERARQIGGHEEDGEVPDWRKLIVSATGWRTVAHRYLMEWKMVWKDVTFGFTVAGVIAAFVPPDFFQALFVGSGSGADPAVWQTLLHTLIGPLAAFFTFIGSMGNIPLAAILFSSGVSFAGVMAFIFSDLVVFPVLRISSQYFGWKLAAYILVVFLVCLVATAMIMHYGFAAAGLLPDPSTAKVGQTDPAARFQIDYTFWLNVGFVLVSAGLASLVILEQRKKKKAGANGNHGEGHHHHGGASRMSQMLTALALAAIGWLTGGVIVWLVI